MRRILLLLVILAPLWSVAQELKWLNESTFAMIESGSVGEYKLPSQDRTDLIPTALLAQAGLAGIETEGFKVSADKSKVLLFVNTRKVWRLNTRGDYYWFDLKANKYGKLGKGLSPSSLMFAKFSPDLTKAAYVSEYNLYVEDLATGTVTALTTGGTRKLINGTFDWAYEEEFSCRDGFQWSPDSKHLSYWQVDATRIRDFYMINNTDSVYSRIVPVEYPTAGQSPSPARIGIVDVATRQTIWVPVPGDPQQHYLPRMEWNPSGELFIQQLNRKQNESNIYVYQPAKQAISKIYSDKDEAWIDTFTPWEDVWSPEFRHEFRWINAGKEFIWFSEKDGWRHVYRISREGKETLVTVGDFDVMDIRLIDEKNNFVYYIASPTNATQKYLYRSKLDGKGKAERVTPMNLSGTHEYDMGPGGLYAFHEFSNANTQGTGEWITVKGHKPLDPKQSIDAQIAASPQAPEVEFFKVKTAKGVEMDGWMVKPENFDPTKKYPVLFLVYTEPWGANVTDQYGSGYNYLYTGDMRKDGYIYMSIDNRGTPAPKGRAWRKSVYRKIGRLNIEDQADAAREIIKWPYVDANRIAVWGWSGGGSATLNLMFQYPDIYKTGIAVAAVANQLTYDNIYQERFMGLPEENLEDFVAGSPITYARNLKGNLLYIHGTGDDNVHYSNAEMLINELVKHGKQFQLMVYPNRTHGISEGEGTTAHLRNLYTEYLRKNCPPGGR